MNKKLKVAKAIYESNDVSIKDKVDFIKKLSFVDESKIEEWIDYNLNEKSPFGTAEEIKTAAETAKGNPVNPNMFQKAKGAITKVGNKLGTKGKIAVGAGAALAGGAAILAKRRAAQKQMLAKKK